jgi:hypothetical protein
MDFSSTCLFNGGMRTTCLTNTKIMFYMMSWQKNLVTWRMNPPYRQGLTGWYHGMPTRSHSRSSSFTSVSGRMASNQILMGVWSGVQKGPTPGRHWCWSVKMGSRRRHSFNFGLHITAFQAGLLWFLLRWTLAFYLFITGFNWYGCQDTWGLIEMK